jgi:glutathione S-transferase
MLKVYHAPRTRSIRILWLLEELGLPYDIEKVAFTPKPMPFGQSAPFGKVPALSDDDMTMFESGAMVEYILERYGNGRLAPAVGHADRPAYLQWLHFAESTAFAPVSVVVWMKLYRQDAEQNAAIIADAQVRAAVAFEFLEKHMGDHDYLLPSGFSAADIMMGFTLNAARSFGIIDEKFTKLDAYSKRLAARPALVKAAAL